MAKLRHSLQPKCDMLLYCRREENNLIAELERESVSRNDRESVLSSECLRLINDRQIAVAIALITDYWLPACRQCATGSVGQLITMPAFFRLCEAVL